ncbi:MAG: ATP-binding protein, partial [Thermoplasmata archaeon]
AIKILKQNYNSYLGLIFEEVVKEFLWRTKPFQFQKIGRWWYKDKEIDLVMLNEQTKDIAFFECKWKKLGYQQCLKILEELKEKASFVEWFNEKRKEHYGIIAKKIENKEDLRKKDYLIYDLDDWDIK